MKCGKIKSKTYRYLLPHASLGEVRFHPTANLPYDHLCWLTLVRPLTCMQLVPDGAVKTEGPIGSVVWTVWLRE